MTAQTVTIPDANFKAKLLQANVGIQIAKNLVGQWFKIDANSDGQIQNTEAQQVSALYVNFSNITNMTGIASFTAMKVLSCYDNTITALDVSALTQLQELYCYNNNISSLIITGTNLHRLDCFNNVSLPALNLTGLNTMEYLDCSSTSIVNLNVSNFTNLVNLFFGGGVLSQWYLQTLNISGCTSLTTLSNIQEPSLTNFNLSNCTALQSVSLGNCHVLTSLNVSGCTNMQQINIYATALTTLNVSGLTNLIYLSCTQSSLNSLNVSGLTNLSSIDCRQNDLSTLDLTGITNLTSVDCSYNQILSLNLTGLNNLNYLICSNNQLLSLDLSDCHDIGSVDCRSNQILSLIMKNGKHEEIDFSNNPIMLYICTDDFESEEVQNEIDFLGYANCQVNTYCSFVPGGVFYTIQGTSKIDINNNGCDVADANYGFLKYDVTNGTISGSVLANATGAYSIPVTVGTHTVTPALENSAYFNVSPANVQVSFPASATPFTQNFCISPNGVHADLEVIIVSNGSPVPGFNVGYKLIYKNKGNQIQSGQVIYTFDDNVSDFVSATPAVSSQALNTLTWNFTNLQPFETRSINFILNLNAPTDTPPLNSGDTLSSIATINPVAGDETGADNVFNLDQYVFNSQDPNDKVCLEGSAISPSMVGRYLHYKIRFENTGNFPAQNIVVKDIIDTSMFDINSLQMVDASHACVTKVSDGNKVEFIFENINLPIDDANNDGYVVFKIKTKPTVVLGDILKNQADIYFDYNFPVITNEAQTLVQTLGNQHYDLTNVKAYPNPVQNILNIESSETLKKADVFDVNGRILLSSQINNNQIDLSRLAAGVYFVKIYSNDKIGVIKITKE